MKAPKALLGILAITAALCASAFAQPYTDASVTMFVAVTSYDPPYSRSDPHSVSIRNWQDYSGNQVYWGATAQANTTYGFNSAYADQDYASVEGYLPPSVEPATTASYSLNWSTADNSQSGSLITVNTGLGDSINSQYSGVLSFLYGTPYNIQSLLGLNGSYSGTDVTASSTWADTITILGQPEGTAGEAKFTVSLLGSISFQMSQPVGYALDGTYVFDQSDVVGDFSGGATLSSIELPDGASIESASGTLYPVPEPSALGLLAIGATSLLLCRLSFRQNT